MTLRSVFLLVNFCQGILETGTKYQQTFIRIVFLVIAISGPCKSQTIFNLKKISAVIPQTTAKCLLTSFLALTSHSSSGLILKVKKIQDIGKIHGKFLITSSSRDWPLPEKINNFRVTADNQEHDAKNVC